jgi:hypothetical protein
MSRISEPLTVTHNASATQEEPTVWVYLPDGQVLELEPDAARYLGEELAICAGAFARARAREPEPRGLCWICEQAVAVDDNGACVHCGADRSGLS